MVSAKLNRRVPYPLDELDTVEYFGIPFVACESEAAFADCIMAWEPQPGRPPLLVTPNVDLLVQMASGDHHVVEELFASADVLLPDGFPIVATSRLAGDPLPSRLAGSTLFACLWPRLAITRRPVTVVAASSMVAENLRAEHTKAHFIVPPMMEASFESTSPIADLVIARAIESKSDFIVIGIGFPKDAYLAKQVIDRWPTDQPAPMVSLLGASAELYLGLKKRAPNWVQRIGMEWLYRFSQEPKRMFTRYFVRDLAFFPMAFREIRTRK